MPEFILPAEADHCPHCGAVLRDPPNCCETMEQEYSEEMHRRYPASDSLPLEDEYDQADCDWHRDDDDEPARRYYGD
jgi:Zn-finger nucleic acid-binding protein